MTSSTLCDDVVARYLDFLSGDFETAPSPDTGRGCYVLTPFVRPDGEAIELELTLLPNGNARLSDMGDTLGYLYVNGLSLTQSVMDKVRSVARRHQISLLQSALVIESEGELPGDAVHRLVQAVIEASALVQGRRSAGRVHFETEVEAFIIQSGVIYDVDYRVPGRLEPHRFKFHVNSGRNLLVQPITAATESAAHSWAERWAYRFSDTIAETSYMNPIAILDDRGNRSRVWTEHSQAPIQESAILWTNRENLSEMLKL